SATRGRAMVPRSIDPRGQREDSSYITGPFGGILFEGRPFRLPSNLASRTPSRSIEKGAAIGALTAGKGNRLAKAGFRLLVDHRAFQQELTLQPGELRLVEALAILLHYLEGFCQSAGRLLDLPDLPMSP